MTLVRAYPRIHITLIDLADATPRRYGGLGFALDQPSISVEVAQSDTTFLIDNSGALDPRGREQILAAVSRLNRLTQSKIKEASISPRITLVSSPPAHVGLGTKTATVLAILMGCSELYELGLSNREIQITSGRGGASGVGIHTFFHGGFTIDLGHPASPGSQFSPSSGALPSEPPPLLSRLSIPPEWEFHLVIPRLGESAPIVQSGDVERDFFAQHTPIAEPEVALAAAWAYHGVAAAFATGDLNVLRESLARIQNLGFKKLEVTNHGKLMSTFIQSVTDAGYPAGMSSMGPLVFIVSRRHSIESEQISELCSRLGANRIGTALGWNRGFEFC